ncbi:MAG: hypothetical protein LBH73_01645 [Spirochaetaceae bacterium]|jgi:hypothetical protein|nr:hypothetical protein [Spirochaetaceae bacterium]
MAEKQYRYTAKIKQPQTAANVKLDPRGGILSEREIKTLKKDAYGASLLEKGLLTVEEAPVSEPDHDSSKNKMSKGKTGNDSDETGREPPG